MIYNHYYLFFRNVMCHVGSINDWWDNDPNFWSVKMDSCRLWISRSFGKRP